LLKKVLIIEKIHKSGIKLIENRDDFSYEVVENLEINFLKNKLKDCDAVCLKVFKFNKELIEVAIKLKIISRHGVGYDNVDIDTVKKKNITLAITAKANAGSVAEHVFFMMLNISRGIDIYDKLTGDSLVANSNNYESLTKIYETMRSRKTKSAYRRHLMRNMTEDSTWFYLNKQAAFADVTVLCDEADESPLGPIKIILHSENIEDVIDWLVSDME